VSSDPERGMLRFATIAFRTSDVGRLATWYRDVFGFRMSERPGDGAQYRPDETWSELHAPDPDHEEPEIEFLDEAMHALPPLPAAGRPGPILAFRTDDIHVAVERLERRGVARASDIFDETWGWCCYFKDPDGNDLEVFQYRAEPWPDARG
jgi:catechol 2,3-dioxygenase-like lactoylglutathione lyase family enzyme